MPVEEIQRHTVALQRVATSLLNEGIYPSLQESYSAVRKLLVGIDKIKDRKQLNEIQKLISNAIKYDTPIAWAAFTEGLENTAVYEAAYYAKLVGETSGVTLSVPASAKVKKYINQSLMTLESGTIPTAGKWAELVKDNTASHVAAINKIVKHGYASELSGQQMIKTIRSTYNGMLKRNAEALSRTAMSHYSTQAREAMALDNATVIKSKYFYAVFDNRTTKTCIGFHGKTFKLKSKDAPTIPLHYNCRSSWIYLTKGQKAPSGDRVAVGGESGDAAEAGFDKRQARQNKNREAGRTARKVGYRGRKDSKIFDTDQIKANTPVDTFFRSQPKWWIESTLGKTRAELFLSGRFKLDQFTDAVGRPLTLKELIG